MKRIIRLTESDLARIVKRVLKEQNDPPYRPGMEPSTKKTETPLGVNPSLKPDLEIKKSKEKKWWESMGEMLKSEGFSLRKEGSKEIYTNSSIGMAVVWSSDYKKEGSGRMNADIDEVQIDIYDLKKDEKLRSLIPKLKDGEPDLETIFPTSLTKNLQPGCYETYWTASSPMHAAFGGRYQPVVKVWCKDSMKKIISFLKNL